MIDAVMPQFLQLKDFLVCVDGCMFYASMIFPSTTLNVNVRQYGQVNRGDAISGLRCCGQSFFFRLFGRILRKNVGTEIPNWFANSAAVNLPPSHKARIPSSCFFVVFLLAPPRRPRARAVAKPAFVLSRIIPLNSANTAKTWKMSLPLAALVLMSSVREMNCTPEFSRRSTISSRSRSERPRRSSFQATRVSPFRNVFEAAGELRPVHLLAALLLNINRLAFCRLQSVDLQLRGLVDCGDARIADNH